jgi:hypothetical protein
MADWTSIPDATFDPDRPVLGSTHLAIVKNFEALAEGASGAPRIETAAIAAGAITAETMQGSVAGSTVLFGLSGVTYTSGSTFESFISDATFKATTSCQVRVSAQYRVSGSFIGNVTLRVYKNGSAVLTQTKGTTSYSTHTVDISLVAGDTVRISGTGNETSGGETVFIQITGIQYLTGAQRTVGGI